MLNQPRRPRALAPLLLLIAGCAQQPLGLPPGEAAVPLATSSSEYRLGPTATRRTRPPRATPSPRPVSSVTPTRSPGALPTATPGQGPTPAPASSPGAPTSTPTSVPTSSPPAAGTPALGVNASLGGKAVFAASSAWNQAIDQAAVDANSSALIASIGVAGGLHADFGANWNGGPFGIPYVVVDAHQPRVPLAFDYADESDPGPYPVPPDAPIEGGASATGDRHVLVVDRDAWKLYELFDAHPNGAGWKAGSGATFDLNTDARRPAGWTSADAAGLPIFPGLVRYDEVSEQQVIRHALRFTVAHSRKAYVPPATHFASSNTSSALPPMGMRVRLKASFDLSAFPPQARVVLQALKTYGMIVADNGSNWYISGTPDARWNDDALNTLKSVKGSSFEVVQMGPVTAP